MAAQVIFRVPASGECSLADGHDHAAMAAIDCFPTASNIGIPAGTSLSAYTGPMPITTPTTISGKIFEGSDCPIRVSSGGVGTIIENSQINCTGAAVETSDSALYTATSNATVFAITVRDSTISSGQTSTHCVAEANIDLLRVHISGCENGMSVNQNIRLRDSVIEKLYSSGAEAHEDGIELSYGHYINSGSGCGLAGAGFDCGSLNITLTHNTIFGRSGTSNEEDSTSGIISNPAATGPDENFLLEYSLLSGGGHAIYCPVGITGVNYQVNNNEWTTEFNANVGTAGPSTGCSDETKTGNVYHPAHTSITLSWWNPIDPFQRLFLPPTLYAWMLTRSR